MAQGISRPDLNKANETGGNLAKLADAIYENQTTLSLILTELKVLNFLMQQMSGSKDDLSTLRATINGET